MPNTTPKTSAAIAKDAAMSAPLALQTQSKTMGTANAAHKRFTGIEKLSTASTGSNGKGNLKKSSIVDRQYLA